MSATLSRRFVGFSFLLSLSLALLFCVPGCAPKQQLADQPFTPVDEAAEIKQVPAHLQGDTEAVIRSRYARYNFAFFQKNLAQKTADTVRVALFDTVTVALVTENVTLTDDSVYVWTGHVAGHVPGSAMISFTRTSALGSIHQITEVYEIMPALEDIVRISMKDKTKFHDEGPPIPKERRRTPRQRDRNDDNRRNANRLTVLVIFPSPSMSVFCSSFYKPLILNAMQSNLNGVFNAVQSTGVNANIIIECYTYTPVGGDLTADLSFVRNDAGIAALRDRHEADLVSLIVPSGDFCGRGYENYPVTADDDDRGFTVVRANCALDNYSFAHELGHNFGMRHDRETDDDWTVATCNYGFIFNVRLFNVNFQARDVMAYGGSCNNCTRMGLYSTPLTMGSGFVTFGPMGVECTAPPVAGRYTRANNRQQLIDAAPIVMQWR
ncbi:MAG TPA: M12 family metallo-peptidase [Bacteroidota bacterium]